nr:hypothetical protein [Tanacetum cinerariifolium]
MSVLLAKERILKLIKAWDEKQIKSRSFPELLLQLSNDSQTIDERFKQHVKQHEQAANLAVQQEQEEQAAQSFTSYWNFSMIDDKEVLHAREKFMKAIQTFLQKFSRYPFGVMPKRIKREHEEYISLMEKLLTINSFLRSLGNFHANTIVESLSPSPIPVEDGDSQREEIDLFLDTGDLMPPEAPDVEVFFDPDSGVLTTKVVKGISKHYVLMPNILPTLPTFDSLNPVYDTLLPF